MAAAPSPSAAASAGGEAAAAAAAAGADSHIDERVQQLIQARELHMREKKLKPVPFNRILLQFDLLNMVFRSIDSAFDAFDEDKSGTIEHEELGPALSSMGAHISPEKVEDVFAAADMYHSGRLSRKEFIVCLALGYLLGDIPLRRTGDPADGKVGPTCIEQRAAVIGMSRAEVAAALGDKDDGRALAWAFHTILDAYVQFDTDCSGTLHRDELAAGMRSLSNASPAVSAKDAQKARGPLPASSVVSFLTNERFRELDFDKDGTITFKEFLYTCLKWSASTSRDEVDEDDE